MRPGFRVTCPSRNPSRLDRVQDRADRASPPDRGTSARRSTGPPPRSCRARGSPGGNRSARRPGGPATDPGNSPDRRPPPPDGDGSVGLGRFPETNPSGNAALRGREPANPDAVRSSPRNGRKPPKSRPDVSPHPSRPRNSVPGQPEGVRMAIPGRAAAQVQRGRLARRLLDSSAGTPAGLGTSGTVRLPAAPPARSRSAPWPGPLCWPPPHGVRQCPAAPSAAPHLRPASPCLRERGLPGRKLRRGPRTPPQPLLRRFEPLKPPAPRFRAASAPEPRFRAARPFRDIFHAPALHLPDDSRTSSGGSSD
jgi:hypothetical protein